MPQHNTTTCNRAERAIASSVVARCARRRRVSVTRRGGRICTPRCVRGVAQEAGVVLAAGVELVDSVVVDDALEVVVLDVEVEELDEELDEPRLSVL